MQGDAPASWIAVLMRAGMFSASVTRELNMKWGSPAGLAVITPSMSRGPMPASAIAANAASTARSCAVRTRSGPTAASPTPANAIEPYMSFLIACCVPGSG